MTELRGWSDGDGRWHVPPYPEYKDSEVRSLGAIPRHWSVLPIKRVCRLCYGESLAADGRVDGDVVVFGSNGPIGTHDKANAQAPCVVCGQERILRQSQLLL